MSNQLIQSKALKDVIQQDGVKNRLREIMGSRAPQFAAALVQVVSQSFQLQKCEPNSVIGAALTAASLDLSVDPNLGEAHIVPYGDKAQFQIGYIGFGQLAQRSGLYKNLGWCVVHEGELVRYDELSGELELNNKNPDGKVIGYAAKFKLVNGFERAEYWTAERIENHAARYSKAYRYAKGDKKKEETCLWVTSRDRMALKTVLKSLLKAWGPKSIQMQKALKVDDSAIVDADSESVEYVDNLAEVKVASPEFANSPAGKPEVPKVVEAETVEEEEKFLESEPEKETPKTEPSAYNTVKALKGLIKIKGLTEEKVLTFLRGIGAIDDEIKTLETLPNEIFELLNDQLEDIAKRIK